METLLRAQFVFDRVEKTPRPEEKKDLTSFAHGARADVAECPRCSILIRRECDTEPTGVYEEDDYNEDVMKALLPRYISAFRAKEQPYRSLLQAPAQVLEIGPHLGAFMDVAREWDWKPVGVDVGKDTTRFVTSRGYTVHNRPLEECDFAPASFDGVFVWNCFEQIPHPHSLLAEARRITKPGGVLVLRTPNALFYRVCQRRLKEAPDGELALWIVRSLGYNNLLAFPYLHGYEGETLTQLGREHGFRCEAALNSELITLPFPQLPEWVLDENRSAFALLGAWGELDVLEKQGRLTAPWIELIYRAE